MRNKILTPITLYKNFNDALPLKEVTVKSMQIGNADFNYVYFSGRQVKNSRVRIYGLYAKQKEKSLGSILILPDVKDSIDSKLVHHFSNLGYDVLAIDLKGECDNSIDFTKYPLEVEYANYNKCDRSFNFVDNTAKETCWYEWTCVARYAVNFLKTQNPNDKIGVLGIKNGANVLWHLAGTDKRIDASIFLFGGGWLAYKNLSKFNGNTIEIDDERTKFLAGIDAQAYAQYVECPVLYLSTTNSGEFDSERAQDTLLRLNDNVERYLNLLTQSKSVLDDHALKNCELFFKKYLTETKTTLVKPKIEVSVEEDELVFTVASLKKADILSVKVFVSFDDVSPKDRVWYNVSKYEINKSGHYKFRQRVYGNTDNVIAFAVVTYKNGFTSSTDYFYKKASIDSSSSFPSVVFSSTRIPSNFIVEDIDAELLGDVFCLDNFYNFEKGPCDILGISSENTITSYAVKKIASKLNDDSFIKFDVYFKLSDKLKVVIKTNNDVEYSYELSVKGGDFWQNIQIPFTDFKTANGQSLKDIKSINSISLSAIGKMMVNNFILI